MEFIKYDPGISVVIPTYNSARFLARCLASIKSQTHPVDEIVIVDDGSTDSTDALLSDLRNVMPNLVCVRQTNQGESGARNRGLATARHGIVAFLDADDTWTPVHIEECCNAFNLFPDIAIAIAKYELRDENNNSCEDEQVIYNRRDSIKRIPGMVIRKTGNNFLMHSESMLHNMIMDRICFHTSSLVINRNRLSATFNFDIRLRFGADLDFVCELLFSGAKTIYIDNLHTLYYIHSSNTVRTNSDTPEVACEKIQRSTAHKENSLYIASRMKSTVTYSNAYQAHTGS